MYSDWEDRSASIAGEEGTDADSEGNRKLALREPLTQLTDGIVSLSVVSTAAQIDRILRNSFSAHRSSKEGGVFPWMRHREGTVLCPVRLPLATPVLRECYD